MAFPGQLPKAAKTGQHPVGYDGLGLEAFQVPGMAPHRLAGRDSRRRSSSPYWANSLSKQEMGSRKPGCRAVGGASAGMDIMNITTGGYGIENTDASQLCFPTSLELFSTWSLCSLTNNHTPTLVAAATRFFHTRRI